jgi:hypothetical protein
MMVSPSLSEAQPPPDLRTWVPGPSLGSIINVENNLYRFPRAAATRQVPVSGGY